jgi:hypothetical protein
MSCLNARKNIQSLVSPGEPTKGPWRAHGTASDRNQWNTRRLRLQMGHGLLASRRRRSLEVLLLRRDGPKCTHSRVTILQGGHRNSSKLDIGHEAGEHMMFFIFLEHRKWNIIIRPFSFESRGWQRHSGRGTEKDRTRGIGEGRRGVQ